MRAIFFHLTLIVFCDLARTGWELERGRGEPDELEHGGAYEPDDAQQRGNNDAGQDKEAGQHSGNERASSSNKRQ